MNYFHQQEKISLKGISIKKIIISIIIIIIIIQNIHYRRIEPLTSENIICGLKINVITFFFLINQKNR